MDIRRDPSPDEDGLLDWLAELNIPARVVATKADKLGRNQGQVRLARLHGLFRTPPASPPLAFSALTGQGREELLAGLSAAGLLELPAR